MKRISHLSKNVQVPRVTVKAISPFSLVSPPISPSLCFLHSCPALSTTKPGGPNILWTSLPSSLLSNHQNLLRLSPNLTSSRKPTDIPGWNDSVPGLCPEMGCSFSPSHHSPCVRSLLSGSISLLA